MRYLFVSWPNKTYAPGRNAAKRSAKSWAVKPKQVRGAGIDKQQLITKRCGYCGGFHLEHP